MTKRLIMFDLIIATANQISLSLMRNGKYGGATIANMYDYEKRELLLLLLIHGRADHIMYIGSKELWLVIGALIFFLSRSHPFYSPIFTIHS